MLNTLFKYTHYLEKRNTKRNTLSLVGKKSTDFAKISLWTKNLSFYFSVSVLTLGLDSPKAAKKNFPPLSVHSQPQPCARWAQGGWVHWLAPHWARSLCSHGVSTQRLYVHCLLGQLQAGAHTLLCTVLSHEPKTASLLSLQSSLAMGHFWKCTKGRPAGHSHRSNTSCFSEHRCTVPLLCLSQPSAGHLRRTQTTLSIRNTHADTTGHREAAEHDFSSHPSLPLLCLHHCWHEYEH